MRPYPGTCGSPSSPTGKFSWRDTGRTSSRSSGVSRLNPRRRDHRSHARSHIAKAAVVPVARSAHVALKVTITTLPRKSRVSVSRPSSVCTVIGGAGWPTTRPFEFAGNAAENASRIAGRAPNREVGVSLRPNPAQFSRINRPSAGDPDRYRRCSRLASQSRPGRCRHCARVPPPALSGPRWRP